MSQNIPPEVPSAPQPPQYANLNTTTSTEIPKIPGPPREPPPPYSPPQHVQSNIPVQVSRPQLQAVVQGHQMQLVQGQRALVQGQRPGQVQNQRVLIPPAQVYNNTVVQVQPQTVFAQPICVVPRVGEEPCSIYCLHCRMQVTTSTSYVAGSYAWSMVRIILLIGIFFHVLLLGCCFIPLCMDSCKDVEHRCPNCGLHLGTYRRR